MTPSPNFDERSAGQAIDMLVLHYTGMKTAGEALERLRNPQSKVSAHYLIEEDGKLHALVPEDKRAWHAGLAYWDGETNINGCSIGIEIVNPGHEWGYRPFPDAQMAALEILAADILGRHPIPPQRVLGHSDVAPERKMDPGELFDWQRLAKAGIGYWPEPVPALGEMPPMAELQQALRNFGYRIEVTGNADEQTAHVFTAFERHFRPAKVSGEIDYETAALILTL